MKLGPILGALGGGLAGLTLASGGGGASSGLAAISPLLALLLQKKKKKDNGPPADAAAMDPNALAQNPLMQQLIARIGGGMPMGGGGMGGY